MNWEKPSSAACFRHRPHTPSSSITISSYRRPPPDDADPVRAWVLVALDELVQPFSAAVRETQTRFPFLSDKARVPPPAPVCQMRLALFLLLQEK